MICAQFFRDAGGLFCAVTLEGHAGQAPHGKDIVCAAVSALAQSLPYGFARAQIAYDCAIYDAQGRLSLTASPADARAQRETDLLLGAFYDALQDIQSQYPSFVQVSINRR